MSGNAKFKLKFSNSEIELEGSEDFVDRQIKAIENLLGLMKKLPSNTTENSDDDSFPDDEQVDVSTSTNNTEAKIPETFGEWMHTFKSNVLEIDKALITARFVQSKSSSNDFKTADVNKALKDHGIKLSNPSTSLSQLVSKKLMFQTRKVGVLKFMRISQDGLNHLESLKR